MRLASVLLLVGATGCGGSSHHDRDAGADSGHDMTDAGRDASPPIEAGSDAPVCADGDGDGHAAEACGGDDCDDDDAEVHPGVTEDEDFTIEVVDDEFGSGEQVALAAASDGLLYVAYRGPDPVDDWQTLRVANRDEVGWRMDLISRSFSTLWWPAIAATSGGIAHVVWASEGLMHATNPRGEWESEIVDAAGEDTGDYGSIALDEWGVSHVSYRGFEAGLATLRYATSPGGEWEIEVADDVGRSGGFSSLAVSDHGVVHVVFERAEPADDLLYARRQDAVWTVDLVDDDAANVHTSLVLDAAGAPQVAYRSSDGQLRVARRNDDESWSIEAPAPDALVIWDVAAAIDRRGVLHVTFHDNLDHHLHLASGELEGWVVETLDPAGDRGRWSSIGFTPDGTLHVAYSDELGQVLRHVWRSEHDGRDQDCDGVAW